MRSLGKISYNSIRLKRRRRLRFVVVGFFYFLVITAVGKSASYFISSDDNGNIDSPHSDVFGSRRLLSTNSSETNEKIEKNCTEPSIKEFPKDVFSQEQRKYGAVVLHVLLALYMFIALAFVCDDYFISALDKICQRLNLSEDVAGATFMAAGSSAPEFFTSVIGVFITKGDVGVGTIVGSAVFNILIIIALCAAFAGQVIHLTWWPLCRDSMFYTISVAALILTIYDGAVTWWESLIMVLFYILYIVMMKLNPLIVAKIEARKKRAVRKVANDSEAKLKEDENNGGLPQVRYFNGGKNGSYLDLEIAQARRNRMTWKELGMMIMLTDKFSPTTRFRAACLVVILRGDHKKMSGSKEHLMKEKNDNYKSFQEEGDEEHGENLGGDDDEIPGTPFLYPQGSVIRIAFWILSLPLVTLLYFTIPDCRKPKWEAWYMVTFFISIFWICVFSYLMVWMVCVIGFTIGVPDVIMGLVFLAAGTSIPDAISSLLVAREGLGDMAVSNSIGSNVFDILIGLAVPWFVRTAMVKPGSLVYINSRGMIYSVGLLFGSVIFTLAMIRLNKWRLDKKLGVTFFLVYLIFVVISALIEFNVFGFVNYPICPYNG